MLDKHTSRTQTGVIHDYLSRHPKPSKFIYPLLYILYAISELCYNYISSLRATSDVQVTRSSFGHDRRKSGHTEPAPLTVTSQGSENLGPNWEI